MALDRETRKRLSQLGRQPRPEGAAPPPAAAPAPWRGPLTVGDPGEYHGPLADLLSGEALETPHGEYYELRTPVAEVAPWAEAAIERWVTACREGRFPGAMVPEGNVQAPEIVFFDTETTGLNHTPLFLVGMLCHDGEQTWVRQLLARDYSEEAAVLDVARQHLCDAGLLVSYNGTTFDLPYLRSRLRCHRLPQLRVKRHLDILHVARRCIGRSYGNCRLQTLELHLCGRQRCHDIPGAQIPQAYHDFVADGDAGDMRRIIEHNTFDIITLAELAAHLAER